MSEKETKDFLWFEKQLQKEEKWEGLTLSNDFIFSKAMRDQEICKEVLEVLFGKKIKEISYFEEQKVIDIAVDSKSIKLDVCLEDEENTIYNVEMQTTNEGNLPKRSRYYSSMIDLNAIEKGADYNELPKSFVIFICTFDPFDLKRYLYTFCMYCKEKRSLALDDGTTYMFLNTKGRVGRISTALRNFLRFVESNEAGDDLTKRLKDKVDSIKENKEWRIEYMTLLMREREKYNTGYKKGFDNGVAQGVAQERAVWEEKESSWTLERIALEDKNSALKNENLQLLKKLEEMEKKSKS